MINPIPRHFRLFVDQIKTAQIIGSSGELVGWSATAVKTDGFGIGGGTAATESEAIRIAIAESLERLEIQHGLSREEQREVRLAEFPTRCGFAAGFEEEPTRMRSLCEGLERWIWSQWIDRKCPIPQASQSHLSPLGLHYSLAFDDVYYFERIFDLSIPGLPNRLRFGAVVGIKSNGAFPGSRVCSLEEEPWTHALTESYRHLKIYQNMDGRGDIYSYLRKRISHFGQNAQSALDQTCHHHKRPWPNPELDFSISLRNNKTPETEYYLSRSLFKDYIPWHQGPEDRFII